MVGDVPLNPAHSTTNVNLKEEAGAKKNKILKNLLEPRCGQLPGRLRCMLPKI